MNNRGNCLHQDGTSKKGKEFFAVQLQTPQNKSRSLSLRHLGKSDAEEVFHGFMESLGDVAERGEGDTDKNKDMVVASITSSVTDQCAVNGPVLQQRPTPCQDILARNGLHLTVQNKPLSFASSSYTARCMFSSIWPQNATQH